MGFLRARCVSVFMIVALVAVLISACSRSGSGLAAPRRIFFITVDTLRADHLGVYGYARPTSPNLDKLAGKSVRFDRAIAQWPKTTPSFASMFTGQYPQTTGMTHRAAKRLSHEYLTMAEMIHSAGYWTAAVVSNPMLSTELGWNQGFEEYVETWQTDQDLGSDPAKFRTVINAPRVNELALPVLKRAIEQDQTFIWLHYSDPHAPYILPPDFDNPFLRDEFDVGDERVQKRIVPSARIGENQRLGFYVAQYDANILVADRFIGELLDLAEELGLLEDSLIVFASDHGEGMGEHDYYFKHGALPYNTGSHVPLFFSFGDAAGRSRQVDLSVELIDLYPTFQDLLGDQTPVKLEGRSLMPFFAEPGDGERIDPQDFSYAFSESGQPMVLRSYYRSVQDQRWKLVFHPAVDHKKKGQAPPLFELYDVRQDPLEQFDLAGQHESEFTRLWDALSAWLRQGDGEESELAEGEGHSEETRRALEALGYLN